MDPWPPAGGGAQSPQLPVAESGSLLSQASSLPADGNDVFTEDLAEEDLFGSEDEEPAHGEPSAGEAPSGGATRAKDKPVDDEDELDEEALFGDDTEGLDERELFGSDGEGELPDEEELFGPDDGEALRALRAKGPEPEDQPSVAPSETSEMDERDIFGDMSDDEEPEKVEDVIIRRRPAPDQDRTFMTMRLPNVLSVEKQACNPRENAQALLEGYREMTNTQGKQVAKLHTPENCIRWRFKKSPEGQILTDDDGRPQYESNARIVEWEDGSRSLFIGSEPFNVNVIDDRILLFEENSQDIHVCHGVVRHRLVCTPRSLNSATHEMLKGSQFRKYEPQRRSLLISPEETAESKQMYQLEMEQKKKQQKRTAREVAPEGEITAAFLEDGPSVLELKRSFKRPAEATKRAKTG